MLRFLNTLFHLLQVCYVAHCSTEIPVCQILVKNGWCSPLLLIFRLKMGVRFHCTPMPVLKMLHILYSCVNLCIVFDKKHSTMGKFPAKQLKLCGFLPHPHFKKRNE